MLREVSSQKQRLDAVFTRISQVRGDEELLAHWAKYLCILTSGFIEASMRIILSKYTSMKAAPPIQNYIDTQLERITNLNENKIIELLYSFSPNWSRTFLEKRTLQQKDSIDSVVANRHLISHGRSVGITFVRVKQYYSDIVELIRIIDEECVL